MKRLPRPRTWIALLAGIVAGFLVWMLPPSPDWHIETEPESGLQALSPEGRHVMTLQFQGRERCIYSVWDCANSGREPLQITADFFSSHLFSPDGATLTTLIPINLRMWEVRRFDVASGKELQRWLLEEDGLILSPQRELHYLRKLKIHRLKNNEEVCRLPENIDEFKFVKSLGRFAIFAKDGATHCEFIVYDPFRSEQAARMTIPGALMEIHDVSWDGQVVVAGPSRMRDHVVIVDNSGTTRKFGPHSHLSPNGEIVVAVQFGESLPWPQKWWYAKDETLLDMVDWRTGVRYASFRNAQIVFSPDNRHFAVRGPDGVVEVYAWPLRPPWVLLATASLGAAAIVWSIGWLWARWRERKLRMEVPRATTS